MVTLRSHRGTCDCLREAGNLPCGDVKRWFIVRSSRDILLGILNNRRRHRQLLWRKPDCQRAG
uniref:Uncharacterized protein n=1 Tax=Candidatus Kentrum sp. UNK TaxID=2126344 RepID=A0A451ATH0_9GAMM|nr:MAG: hypothetical protein BECKUNK1418G_GA0071005_13751 [Candidatus Kentron sp. UNK]VFK73951.1 MAG: hypothetical protein BECKUNK1418H_GA0071006_13911 [Candidatus Kentron sp. UNK]